MKTNTEILLEASREVDLEVNTEKTTCIWLGLAPKCRRVILY